MTSQITRDQRLHIIISQALNPEKLVIINQSSHHKHHAGDDGTGETHYDVLIISDAFINLNRVKRHRLVTDLLKEEFDTGLHALSLTLNTSQEASQT